MAIPLFPMFLVQADEIDGLTPEREIIMKKVMKIFEKVMNDIAFQNDIASFSYEYDVDGDPNANMTPLQVATKLMDGAEVYKTDIDHTANLHWFIEFHRKPLRFLHPDPPIGYGDPGKISIYTYSWFFDEGDIAGITGHIAHEWSHKVGFDHDPNNHPGRENTVPYAFGYMVEQYAANFVNEV
jgi:hypothetical protein